MQESPRLKTPSKKPLVSVIVITHEAYRKYLPQALINLPSNVEVIVWENESDTLAKACNHAIAASHGKYIVRVDADDIAHLNLIDLEAAYLDDHPEIDCVWCDYWKMWEERLELCPQETLEHAGGAMYRREVWEALGGYNEDLEYQESFDFWLRFHKAGFKAARIDQPLYYYRQHEGSMSTNVEARNKVRQQILERHQCTQ